MTDNQLTSISENRAIINPAAIENYQRKVHLESYVQWLDNTGRVWYAPDLASYRDYLAHVHVNKVTGAIGLKPASIHAHLSHVRSYYRELIRNRDLFYSQVDSSLPHADRKAIVDEVIVRIMDATDERVAKVKQIKKQDHSDRQHTRLTYKQVLELIAMPDTSTLAGLRDRAYLHLSIATGIRADECANLEVADLRDSYSGEVALIVRDGKGGKQRLIPYGEWVDCLDDVQTWLNAAGITSGKVFRAVGWWKRIYGEGVTVRAIEKWVLDYPIRIHGMERQLTPHDLRRTYAALQFAAGVPMEAIRQNLGHERLETTQLYIGQLDGKIRRGKRPKF